MDSGTQLKHKKKSQSQLRKVLLIATGVTICIAAILFYLISIYVIKQAEKNIENLLLSHRGMHHYVQQIMHPALYQYKEEGKIKDDFYAPELLSSSFIVRNQHAFYNKERVVSGLPELYYKMAAINPRNPVNKADAMEENLIRMFNKKPDLKKHREIIEKEGKKYLYVALPFLQNQKRCIKCHGNREDAPRQLQSRYKGPGGFDEKIGEIRAIISIRSPLEREYFTVYIISAALLTGFLVIMFLFFFNRRLKDLVLKRTMSLEKEVAERKNAEAEVRALNQELEQRVENRTMQLASANKELDAFAYSVSHDLRAPLRGIDGFSLALMEDYGNKLDDTAKDYIGRVRNGCVRMGNLIDDLLKLSRLTRGDIHLKKVDVSQMAATILEDLKASTPERELEYAVASGVTVDADPTLIRAVMENLLGNAFKFTGRKSAARIEFGMMQQDDKPVYFVKDNGAGFDMEYADKLFAAFQRLHSPNEFEGTGIGLATVQRIIHRHGGKIWAQGVPGQGATFYFSL